MRGKNKMKKHLIENWGLASGYLVTSLVVSGMSVYLSNILRDIVDIALSFDLDGFYHLLLTSAIFFVLFGIFYYISEALYAGFVAKTLRKVREDVFRGIMNQDMGQFESVNSADYISALTNDVKLLEDNYLLPIATAFQMGATLLIAIGFLLYYSLIVSGGLLGTLILLIIVPVLFGGLVKKRQTKVSESLSLFTIKIKDIFSGFEVIKSFQMDKQVEESFKKQNRDVIKTNFKFYHLNSIIEAVSSVISLFMQVGVVFFSAWLIINGHLSAGTLVAILVVAGQVTGPVQALSQMVPQILGSKEIINRLESLSSQVPIHNGNKEATFNDKICVEGLEFTYPNQEEPALKKVDFTFEKNKKYALVGKSGCGKTTLVKVLIGHLNGYQGNVSYDQIELKELSYQSFGKIPAMVHQNVYMFDETIEQNITLHQSHKSEDLLLAIENSGVSLFLDESRTLQSKVGENGSNLSGGQRQRIAVARALIQNKPLLILDEGTSALDRQTAIDIEGRLLDLDNLTLLTITHSLDSEMLSQYDEIIYMEDGTIVETGSYTELMASQGKFKHYMQTV